MISHRVILSKQPLQVVTVLKMTGNTEGTVELLGVIDEEENRQGSTPQHTPKTFIFSKSREFLLLRWLLRGLSLWYPKSSGCLSRYFYPGLVSFLLACNIVWFVVIVTLKKDVDVIFNVMVVVISTGGFFSHLTASFYLRSRDLEDNMICITLDRPQLNKFRKSLIYFNARIVISMAMFICLICVLVIATVNGYPVVTNYLVDNVYPYHDAYRQCLLCMVTATIIYTCGMYVAIVWIVDVFQLMSNVRLQDQYRKFIKWTAGAEAAINDHICNYMSKVEKSSCRLKWWFLVHNISLLITVPLITMGNLNLALSDKRSIFAAAAEIGQILLVWALPLYFAEKIEKSDKRFCSMVNNFYPEQLFSASSDSRQTVTLIIDSTQNEENFQNLTFIHRTEVQLLVHYLKSIRSGFQSVGYAFQLKLSFISTMISLTVFVFKINGMIGKSK